MTRPYSEDLRERAYCAMSWGDDALDREGAADQPILRFEMAEAKRETGSLTPGQIGGHKKRTLSGDAAEWLQARCRSGPFTTRGLTAELAARGIKTDRRAVWVFLHAKG